MRHEVDPQAPEFLQCENQLLYAPGEAVKAPDDDHVEFRNIRIREFAPPPSVENTPPAGFKSLFNGHDLSGWKGLATDPVKRAKLSAAELNAALFDRALFALGLDLTDHTPRASAPAEVTALAERRWAAKQAKDFAAADTLRKEIAAAGWTMLDRKDGWSLEPVKK